MVGQRKRTNHAKSSFARSPFPTSDGTPLT